MLRGKTLLRLLALRSEHAYTDRLDRAMPDEPEAVSEEDQRELTRTAQRVQHERDRLQWLAARNSIERSLDMLDLPAFAHVEHDLRAIRRILERVEKRVAA